MATTFVTTSLANDTKFHIVLFEVFYSSDLRSPCRRIPIDLQSILSRRFRENLPALIRLTIEQQLFNHPLFICCQVLFESKYTRVTFLEKSRIRVKGEFSLLFLSSRLYLNLLRFFLLRFLQSAGGTLHRHRVYNNDFSFSNL